MSLDRKDIAILAELTENARASHTELSNRVGLSSTALARRQKTLEDSGYIKGYQATLDLARFGLGTTVLVRIALESQSDEALKKFEAEVTKCPSVVRCFLMSGTDDYILIVMARDIEDFERIHRTEFPDCRGWRACNRASRCARSSAAPCPMSYSVTCVDRRR